MKNGLIERKSVWVSSKTFYLLLKEKIIVSSDGHSCVLASYSDRKISYNYKNREQRQMEKKLIEMWWAI